MKGIGSVPSGERTVPARINGWHNSLEETEIDDARCVSKACEITLSGSNTCRDV